DEAGAAARQRIPEILEAVDRIRAIVARMRHLTRVEVTEGAPGLPSILDFQRSSEPASHASASPSGESAPAGGCLVIGARPESARFESLHSMFAGPATEVIVDRRAGAAERRRAGSDADGGRRHGIRRQRDISGDLRTRGWAVVIR